MSTSTNQPIPGDVEIPEVVDLRHTYASATDKINGIVLAQDTPRAILAVATISFLLLGLLMTAVVWLVSHGTGIWGINSPVGWGFDIINFIWWIGVGHAGTMISAMLLMCRQEWRTSINRFAEAMTIFAVMCAGLYPLLHVGRPWMAYWLFPYPNVMQMSPQFRSPLIWDVFAVSTYITCSMLFWYTGLLPDLASLRDRAKSKTTRIVAGILSMGWRGSARHWQHYVIAYKLMAGISTVLVVGVSSIVALDFAASIMPGWHATIFPPYFLLGAVYCGLAMVLVLIIPIRRIFGLKDLITQKHLDVTAKLMLTTGWFVIYIYGMEAFMALVYSGNPHEKNLMLQRMFGPYGWTYWLLILFNAIIPQLLWFRAVRINTVALWCIGLILNVGMWFERFVIVVTTLHRDFLPSSWGMFIPTRWDFAMFLGTLGFFGFTLCLFIRFVPMICGFELRELLHHKKTSHPSS